MTVHRLELGEREAWDAYVSGACASVYHLAGWRDVIERSFRHRTCYLYATGDGGRWTGILPLVHIRSRIFGSYLVSLPYFTYGGIRAGGEDAPRELAAAAADEARRSGARHVELRQDAPLALDWPCKTAKVAMRLDLPADPEALWSAFPAKLRSQIKRPQREGMTARTGGEELLDDFYAVFSRNMRDLGTPVYAKAFFRNILRAFPDMTSIATVRERGGRPVAAGFLLGWKGMLEIPWASSLREHNRFGANMLLYWHVLEQACRDGYRVFDFGRSTPGEGTYRFKEQWGARPLQLHWHYWLADGVAMPELNPHNPKYRLAIALWKRLPVGVTRLVGPTLSRSLP